MASPGTVMDLDDEDAGMHAQLLGSTDSASSAATDPELSRIQASGARADEDFRDGSEEIHIMNTKLDEAGGAGGGGGHGGGHARGAGWRCESLDYDMFESRVNQDFAIDQLREKRTFGAVKWVFTLLIGAFTAMTAIFIDYGVKLLEEQRLGHVHRTYDSGARGTAAATYVLISAAMVLVAGTLVGVVEPVAGGSGIPEIKTMLNGIKVPRAVRAKTLLCKAVGVLFSVAGGLPCGKEGPMIHSGAIVGAAVSQGKSAIFGFDLSFSRFVTFRSEKEKRDFIACGAAAGVAAAFGAPVGGMLFALEEGASFWHPGLTWRSFFCGVCSAFTLSLFLCSPGFTRDERFEGTCAFGYVGSKQGTFGFGVFDGSRAQYLFWYILIFIIMGAVGGLLGACFNAMNTRLTLWRKRHRDDGNLLRDRRVQAKRVCEAVVVGMTMAAVSFGACQVFGHCLPRPQVPPELVRADVIQESPIDFDSKLVQMNCGDKQYNDLASLFLVSANDAIKNLFHLSAFVKELQDKSQYIFCNNTSSPCPYDETVLEKYNLKPSDGVGPPHFGFSSQSLLVFFVLYYIMACWTYGLSVPSGLFVPSLLAGAAYGHLWYQLCQSIGINDLQPDIHPGLFTLVGAAALLGGMARMTISLAVILMELTGVINWGPPVMLTLLAARWTGNAFNEGLYDIHVHLAGYDFLEYKPGAGARSHTLRAHHVMAQNPVCVAEVVRAGDLLDMLQRCSHNGFPVVPAREGHEYEQGGGVIGAESVGVGSAESSRRLGEQEPAQGERRFVGVVLRKALTVALRELDLQGGDDAGGVAAEHVVAQAGAAAPATPSQPSQQRPTPYTRLPRRTPTKPQGGRSRSGSRVGSGEWTPRLSGPKHNPSREALCYRDLEESFPRYPSADDIVLTEQQRQQWLDITPYVNQTPPTVSMHAPLKRTYALFRSLGLRHLVAVDPFNNVVGIITRHDLSEHSLAAKARGQSRENAHKIQHMYSPRVKLSTQVRTPLSAADTRQRSTFDTPTLI
eukprot:g1912.t1